MVILRAAKTISIAVILCSFLSASAESGGTRCTAGSCMAEEENTVTALVQIKRSVNLGTERLGGKVQHKSEHAETLERKVVQPPAISKTENQGESQSQAKKVTFVGKVGDKEWYVWFRKKTEGKSMEPVKPKRIEVDDSSDLLALGADGLAVASGTEDQKAKGWWDNCLALTWSIGDCKWSAWKEGWAWRHAVWDWGCAPMSWMSMYEVAAMLPVHKVDMHTKLAPTQKDIGAMNEMIEKQMKAANYTVRDTKAPQELEAPQELQETSMKPDADQDSNDTESSTKQTKDEDTDKDEDKAKGKESTSTWWDSVSKMFR